MNANKAALKAMIVATLTRFGTLSKENFEKLVEAGEFEGFNPLVTIDEFQSKWDKRDAGQAAVYPGIQADFGDAEAWMTHWIEIIILINLRTAAVKKILGKTKTSEQRTRWSDIAKFYSIADKPGSNAKTITGSRMSAAMPVLTTTVAGALGDSFVPTGKVPKLAGGGDVPKQFLILFTPAGGALIPAEYKNLQLAWRYWSLEFTKLTSIKLKKEEKKLVMQRANDIYIASRTSEVVKDLDRKALLANWAIGADLTAIPADGGIVKWAKDLLEDQDWEVYVE